MSRATRLFNVGKLTGTIPDMNGWTTADRCVQMYDLVHTLGASTVVEIGVFAGRTLISQAIALKERGAGRIYGIDPWWAQPAIEGMKAKSAADYWMDMDFHKIHNECVRWIWEFGVQDHVVLLQCRAHDCADIIPKCDILNIDGNHEEVSSTRDVELYLPKVKQNGFIWFDDADWPQTQNALRIMDQKCALHTDFGHYRLYAKKTND